MAPSGPATVWNGNNSSLRLIFWSNLLTQTQLPSNSTWTWYLSHHRTTERDAPERACAFTPLLGNIFMVFLGYTIVHMRHDAQRKADTDHPTSMLLLPVPVSHSVMRLASCICPSRLSMLVACIDWVYSSSSNNNSTVAALYVVCTYW